MFFLKLKEFSTELYKSPVKYYQAMVSSRLIKLTQTPKILALCAGMATVMAYAPFNVWFIAPIAVAVLLKVNHQASPKQAAQHGFLFGLTV